MQESQTKDQSQARTDGYIPVDVDSISVKQYLFDANTMLDEINKKLDALIQLTVNKEPGEPRSEKERLVRTIGGNH